jgi:hypothetical protein
MGPVSACAGRSERGDSSYKRPMVCDSCYVVQALQLASRTSGAETRGAARLQELCLMAETLMGRDRQSYGRLPHSGAGRDMLVGSTESGLRVETAKKTIIMAAPKD